MKNKDILDMVVQLYRAKHGLSALKTEAGNSPFTSVDMFEVQVGSKVMKEYFGINLKFSPRGCSQYPIEASAEYKGIPFIAIMAESEAREIFGYDAKAEGV